MLTTTLKNIRYLLIRNIFSNSYVNRIKLPFKLFFIGGRNILETLLVLILLLIGVIGCLASSGGDASAFGFFTIICGLRYNIIGFLTGISFERMLFYHKILAFIAIIISILHGIHAGYNFTGVVLLSLMGFISILYIIKPYIFELFYNMHLIGNIGILIFAKLHGVNYIVIGGIIWLIDLFIRYLLLRTKNEAIAEILPAGVIRISLNKKNFQFTSGQYCFIMIPELSYFEFHPFTISSAPHENEIKFHIRTLGNWTQRLHDYLLTKEFVHNGKTINGTQLIIHVEGPFGISSVDFENTEISKVILLVTGGIGVTPAQSHFNHLIHQYTNEGRNIRKCIYIWSVKDRAMISPIDHARVSERGIDITNTKLKVKPALPKSFQPNLVIPDDILSNNISDMEQNNDGIVPVASFSTSKHNGDNGLYKPNLINDNNDIINNTHDRMALRKKSFSFTQEEIQSHDPFHVEFYLTSCRNKEDFDGADIHPDHQPYLNFGRPKLPEKWTKIAEMCIRESITRVSVLVCGPDPMILEVEELCSVPITLTTTIKSGEKITGTVYFDLHKEEFNF